MRTLVALLAIVIVAGLASGRDEGCPTTAATLTLPTPAGTYYVVDDGCQPQCTFSTWIYQESNGIEGLQRCSEVGEGCWTCHGDTIIF